MRLVMSLALAGVFALVGIGMLRSLTHRPHRVLDEPELVDDDDARTVYRCDACGTEVLLLIRGSDTPPRHCGERMSEREEIPHA